MRTRRHCLANYRSLVTYREFILYPLCVYLGIISESEYPLGGRRESTYVADTWHYVQVSDGYIDPNRYCVHHVLLYVA